MRYPEFVKQNGTIGITALSAGVGRKLPSFDRSLLCLQRFFKTKETASVRVNNIRSNTAMKRAEEFNELVKDEETDLIMIASGGEFLMETLPYIDWTFLNEHPKFVCGYSDPTSLLFCLTTVYDIATIYGINAGSFDEDNFHKSIADSIEIIKGNLVEQHSYDLVEGQKEFEASAFNLDTENEWISLSGDDISEEGIMIGGCLDVLKNIFGTEYDGTKEFIKRYPEGLIWYFDIYEMSPIELYLTILQLKYSGYLENTKAFILGRILFQHDEDEEYLALLKQATDIPLIFNADIGHVNPSLTIINGATTKVTLKNGKGVIRQWL